jgi:hypothetical protein
VGTAGILEAIIIAVVLALTIFFKMPFFMLIIPHFPNKVIFLNPFLTEEKH